MTPLLLLPLPLPLLPLLLLVCVCDTGVDVNEGGSFAAGDAADELVERLLLLRVFVRCGASANISISESGSAASSCTDIIASCCTDVDVIASGPRCCCLLCFVAIVDVMSIC